MSNPTLLTVDSVEKILTMMQAHGATELEFLGLKIKRGLDAPPKQPGQAETEFDILKRKPPDSIDAALMLRRHKGNV